MITGIDPKALQLTIILLRQYHPRLASLLPGPEQYPSPGTEVNLDLDPDKIPEIIKALNDLGTEWLAEKPHNPTEKSRNSLRQKCLIFILDEWIRIGEQYEHQVKVMLH